MIKVDTTTGSMEASGSVVEITADVVTMISDIFSMIKQTGDEFSAGFFRFSLLRAMQNDDIVFDGKPVPGAVCASIRKGGRK